MAAYIPKQGDIIAITFDPQSGHEPIKGTDLFLPRAGRTRIIQADGKKACRRLILRYAKK